MESITSAAAPPATRSDRRSALLTIALGLIVLGVGLWFAIDAFGGWYPIFKWIHVSLAVFWVGGGLTLTILGLKAERSNDPQEIALLADQAGFVGARFFAPSGLIVFLAGIGMVINGELGWSSFWVIAGLVGYASTFLTGLGVLTPLAKRLAASTETLGVEHPETQALIRRLLLIVRIDVAVLLLVVADMISKPFS